MTERKFTIRWCLFSALMTAGTFLLPAQENAVQTFIDTRIVNGHSVETNPEGIAKFIISHRFGAMNSGVQELFGLDNATIRIGLDYGVKDWLSAGFGRSSLEKTLDGYAKFRWLRQKEDKGSTPLSITSFHSVAMNTLPWSVPERENFFSSRLVYVHQVLLARKVSEDLSVQLMPTLVHRNLVSTFEEENDVLSLGIAMRYKISQHWALSSEYYYIPDSQLAGGLFMPLALGIEIDTRGHVFQFQFGNAQGMVEKFFITETRGDILEGDIHFGFNITRDFKLKGRREG